MCISYLYSVHAFGYEPQKYTAFWLVLGVSCRLAKRLQLYLALQHTHGE
jgi:hypothetical protein